MINKFKDHTIVLRQMCVCRLCLPVTNIGIGKAWKRKQIIVKMAGTRWLFCNLLLMKYDYWEYVNSYRAETRNSINAGKHTRWQRQEETPGLGGPLIRSLGRYCRNMSRSHCLLRHMMRWWGIRFKRPPNTTCHRESYRPCPTLMSCLGVPVKATWKIKYLPSATVSSKSWRHIN